MTHPLWEVVNRPLGEYRGRQGYPAFDRAWRIDVCRDGTFTIRRRGEPSFNGAALPVFSTRTKKEAESLQIVLCFHVHGDHPKLRAGDWYKLNDVLKTGRTERGCAVFDIDDHQAIAWKIADVAAAMRKHRRAAA